MDEPKEEKTMEKKCSSNGIKEEYLRTLRAVRLDCDKWELELVNEFLTDEEERKKYEQEMSEVEKNLKPPEKNKFSDPAAQTRYEEWWNINQKAIAAGKRMKPLVEMYVYIFF